MYLMDVTCEIYIYIDLKTNNEHYYKKETCGIERSGYWQTEETSCDNLSGETVTWIQLTASVLLRFVTNYCIDTIRNAVRLRNIGDNNCIIHLAFIISYAFVAEKLYILKIRLTSKNLFRLLRTNF